MPELQGTKRMRQVWRYLPAVGAALFAPTALFVMAPNAVILLNLREIGYDWGLVVISLQAFAASALLCALAFVLALRSRALGWLPRLVILLGASVLLWDALSPLLDTWGKSTLGGLLIEGVAFLVLALVLFRLKLANLYFIFGAIAPVLLISGLVSHYTTVKAVQDAYDAGRLAPVAGSADAVGGSEAGGNETGGWRLVHYDVDEDRLAQDQPVDLKLYWTPPSGVEPIASADFYRQENGEWVQVIRQARNLAPNGGFEQGDGFSGFPNDLYKAPPETREVVADTRNNQATKVVVLKNGPQAPKTSLVSALIAVSPKRLYLQAGWLRSDHGGVGYLGRVWLPKGAYDYFVKSDSQSWSHYIQIIQSPTDATQVQIGAANLASSGQVYYDNLVFVELGRIDEAACQPPATSGAPPRCGPPLLTEAPN